MGFAKAFGRIGEGHPTYIIAEGGLCHFGSYDLASRMVEVAASSGADAFKTQAFKPELLYEPGEWRERIRGRALPDWAFERLEVQCRRHGMDFLVTPHDDHGLEILRSLNVPYAKIGSGERGNPAFIRKIAGLGKPVIISTGMHEEHHLLQAIGAIREAGCNELALLHCVTGYPVDPNDANLSRMHRLRGFSPIVGYSDHCKAGVPVVAACMGAQIIEMHFGLGLDIADSNDSKVSHTPVELAVCIAQIRRAEVMRGDGSLDPRAIELEQTWALKGQSGKRAG